VAIGPVNTPVSAVFIDEAIREAREKGITKFDVLGFDYEMGLDMQIIMLTGHGSQEAARDGIRLGAFDYLTKPCELLELIEKINEAWRKRLKNIIRE